MLEMAASFLRPISAYRGLLCVLNCMEPTKIHSRLKSIPSIIKYSSNRRENYSFVTDEKVARDVAIHVCKHINSGTYVFEANPGPGVLSKALLEAGVLHLRVCEKGENLTPAVKNLASMYPESLEILPEDIMLLPKLEMRNYHEVTDETDVFFHGIERHPWNEAIPISLVAVAADRRSVNFMRSMLAKISMMSSLFAFGRCQFFLILSEKEYMNITAQPKKNLDKYRASTMLYNIFFDINFIRKIPGSCLSPVHMSSEQKTKWKASHLYFVHLVPKADLFESVAPIDKLPDLYYFVRHHMNKRTDYIIQTMEKWIPSCGPRLIFEGIKVYTRFGDLTPLEMLNVFHLFSSCPEYNESTFKYIVNVFFNEYFYGVSRTEDDASQDENY